MIVIDPYPILDANLIGSSVPELPVTEYAPGTTYAAGARAGITTGTVQAIYESLQSANSDNPPSSAPAWWKYVGSVYHLYSPSVTYGIGDVVANIAAGVHELYESLVAPNLGNALSDATKWTRRLYGTNRWRALDQLTNSATEAPNNITFTLSPGGVFNRLFLGGVSASSVTVTQNDAIDGTVFSDTASMALPSSGCSMYGWLFNPIQRRKVYLSPPLLPYRNSTITVSIDRPGDIAKCGMLAVGMARYLGDSQYGASPGVNDYSSRTITPFGESKTVVRDSAKSLSDIFLVNNNELDAVYDFLNERRQKNMVWIIEQSMESLIGYGPYKSFRPVVGNPTKTSLSLDVDGVI